MTPPGENDCGTPDLHPERQDDREWTLRYDTRTRGYNIEGPSITPWDVEVVPKASRVAAEARQAELERERDALKKALREIICCNHYGASFRDAERIARAALTEVVDQTTGG